MRAKVLLHAPLDNGIDKVKGSKAESDGSEREARGDTGKNPGAEWCIENVRTWDPCEEVEDTKDWETASEKWRSRSKYMILGFRETPSGREIRERRRAKIESTQSAT